MRSIPVSVLLVHGRERERAQLRTAFEALPGVRITGERADLRSALAAAGQTRPHVLVLELPAAAAAEAVLEAAARFRIDHPEVALFLVADAFDPNTLLAALRAGAQEVLRWPLDRATLAAAVERVAAGVARQQEGRSARRIVTVFATKGGTGVSTLAAHLAVGLRRETRRDVALADLDAQSGDAAFLLGLTPVRSIADVLAGPQIDSAAVQDALVRHASGVYVLPQPESLEHTEGVTGRQAGAALDVLATLFETVVVDAPHRFDEVALETFDRSSVILLVTEPTMPSVRAARRAQEIFQRLNPSGAGDRLRLVLNRHHPQSAIQPAHVADTLGLPVFATVANDYATVSRAADLGRPTHDDKPASRAARDFAALARLLAPPQETNGTPEPAVVPRSGRLRLFGKGRTA